MYRQNQVTANDLRSGLSTQHLNTGCPSIPFDNTKLHQERIKGDPASAAANLQQELPGFYERHFPVVEWSVGE